MFKNIDLLEQPFLYYIKRNLRDFSLGVITLFMTNALDVIPPLVLAKGIDQMVAGQSLSEIFKTSLLYFGILAGVALFRFFWRIYWGRFQHTIAEDLRNQIFFKLTQMGPSYYQTTTTGELMSLISNDVSSFQRGIGPGILVLLDAVMIFSMVLPLMIYFSWEWTWKSLVLLPLLPFLVKKITSLIHFKFKKEQEKFSQMTGIAQEIISAIRMIKSFAQEKSQTHMFNIKSAEFEKACNDVALTDSFFDPLMQFSVAIGSAILFIVAAPDLIRGVATIGAFIAFHRYIQKMVWPMTAIGMGISMVQRGLASFQRIKELITTPTDMVDEGTLTLNHFEKMEFKNLTFTYPKSSTPALKNISLTIHKGESVGIVGPVGSGKSTLFHLLTRLHPPPPRTIFINGIDILEYKLKSLRQVVTYVLQDPFLFSDTISKNIAFGLHDSPNSNEIREVTETVSLLDEVESFSHQFETLLGEKGLNLSGGQKQRLTIARGIIRSSPVILFDDSLSSVDSKTEKFIEQCLLKKSGRNVPTRLIVSHRISSVQDCHKIIVLNEGKIEAIDTHHQLLETSPTYERISELQAQLPPSQFNSHSDGETHHEI